MQVPFKVPARFGDRDDVRPVKILRGKEIDQIAHGFDARFAERGNPLGAEPLDGPIPGDRKSRAPLARGGAVRSGLSALVSSPRGLSLMIGTVLQNRNRAVDLLHQKEPRHFVSKGHGREREEFLGGFLHRFIQPAGPADDKRRFCPVCTAQFPRKIGRRNRAFLFRQGQRARARRPKCLRIFTPSLFGSESLISIDFEPAIVPDSADILPIFRE